MSLVGKTIAGKYEIVRTIGAGGMGAVYEAEHLAIGKRVAVKVMDKALASSPEIAERFRREARAASAALSDHIVEVSDAGQDEETGLYIVMELLDGEDLSARLERERKLPVKEALRIARDVARALAKAHAKGVVHRDLKPGNIFLVAREDEDPKVKVLDFGIAKWSAGDVANASPQAPMTRAGTVVGTPSYMSPEQAQGLPVDSRTDVWALGAVLFEALSGERPYPDLPTYEQTIIRIVTTKPPLLSAVAKELPDDVVALVAELLAHDVEQRPRDCAVLAKRMTALLGQATDRLSAPVAPVASPAAPAPHSPATAPAVSVHTPPPRSGRQRIVLGVVAAASCVVVAAVAAVVTRPESPGVSPSSAAAPSTAATPSAPILDPIVSIASVPGELPLVDAAVVPPPQVGAGPVKGRLAKPPPGTPKPPPDKNGQFGAAGVSTAY